MNEGEFEEEAEENLSVETDDEIRAGPVSFMAHEPLEGSGWAFPRCHLPI